MNGTTPHIYSGIDVKNETVLPVNGTRNASGGTTKRCKKSQTPRKTRKRKGKYDMWK
jgi:hypothetical protein